MKNGKRKPEFPPSNDQVIVEVLVTEEARQHGDYRAETISVTDGEFDGQTKGEMGVVRNRGGTAVARWANSGALDQRQVSAIELYRRAWLWTFGEPRVTMNWSLTNSIRGFAIEVWIADKGEAEQTLREIDRIVLDRLPPHYRDLWQNVVIHDEPAGVAGGRLGFVAPAQTQAVALTVVRLVCDLIATEWKL